MHLLYRIMSVQSLIHCCMYIYVLTYLFVYLFIYIICIFLQIQPNLVNLAAAPMSTPAYLPSPPLTGFSSGLALNASPGQESSLMLSHNINPPAGFNAGHSKQGSFPSCSTPLQETTSPGDDIFVPGSATSSDGEATEKMRGKKLRKRKLLEEDGNNDSQAKQAKL